MPDAREHDVASDRIELEVAARREEREVPLDLLLQVLSAATEQCPVAEVESELAAMEADEVEDGAFRLAGGSAQASAELLKEQRRALGRAQQQQGVDVRHVDALVEEVDGEQRRQRRRRRGRAAPIAAPPGLESPHTARAEMPRVARTAAP